MRITTIFSTSIIFIGWIKFGDSNRGFINLIEEHMLNHFTSNCSNIKNVLGFSYDKSIDQAIRKLNNVYFNLYTSDDMFQEKHLLLTADRTLYYSPNFNILQKTLIIIHGYFVNSDWAEQVLLAKNLKSLGNLNVLTLDYRSMSVDNYFLATVNTQYIGEALGDVLSNLHQLGAKEFHLIGHSLGAHISGFAGKIYKSNTGTLIQRITGLDAAGPCFFNEVESKRLAKTDAEFVDVIHTGAHATGMVIPIGHVDFYPNSGSNMPGCSLACSHGRALDYYTESVIVSKNGFLAVKCTSWEDFLNKYCINNPVIYMGYWLSDNINEGKYYLKTAVNSPFALYKEGLI